MRPHWRKAAVGVFSLLIVNALGVYIPLLIRDGLDELQATFDMDRVIYYAVLILVLACGMWIVRMSSRILLFGVGRQVEFDLKQRIFNHLLTLEPSYFSRNTPGDLISRATRCTRATFDASRWRLNMLSPKKAPPTVTP